MSSPLEPTPPPDAGGALVTTRKKNRDTPRRVWLDAKTADIIGAAYRQACDAVRIGLVLEEVRGKLRHGAYKKWVQTALPFSISTARRYRLVAAAFGRYQKVHFELFDELALYALADFRVPQPVREHAILLAEDGRRITQALALEIIDAHRSEPRMAPAGCVVEETPPVVKVRRCLGAECEGTFTGPLPGFCDKCKKKLVAGPEVAKELKPEQVLKRWRIVEELAERCTELRISKVEDTDDDEALFEVRAYFPNADPKVTVRRDLYDVLAVCAGKEETRHCGKCGHDLPIGQFGKNKLNPGGLMYRCRPCEKARRREMRVQARAERAAARAGAPSGTPAA